jgi:hypothetical protein
LNRPNYQISVLIILTVTTALCSLDQTADASPKINQDLNRNNADAAMPSFYDIDLADGALNVSIDPRDKIPPYDLIIKILIKRSALPNGTWSSTQLQFSPLGKTQTIGGQVTCTNKPTPSISLETLQSTFRLRMRSNNNFGSAFDWRLYPGQYRANLRLFSEPDCNRRVSTASVSKVITVKEVSNKTQSLQNPF